MPLGGAVWPQSPAGRGRVTQTLWSRARSGKIRARNKKERHWLLTTRARVRDSPEMSSLLKRSVYTGKECRFRVLSCAIAVAKVELHGISDIPVNLGTKFRGTVHRLPLRLELT